MNQTQAAFLYSSWSLFLPIILVRLSSITTHKSINSLFRHSYATSSTQNHGLIHLRIFNFSSFFVLLISKFFKRLNCCQLTIYIYKESVNLESGGNDGMIGFFFSFSKPTGSKTTIEIRFILAVCLDNKKTIRKQPCALLIINFNFS